MRFTNERGDTVYLGDEAPFIYLHQKGLDGMDATPMLIKSPFQHGKTSMGNDINERVVSLECALLSKDEAENENLRRKLFKSFNPLFKGTLEITGNTFKRCCYDVEVSSAPKFKDEDYTDFQEIMMWQVNLVVPGAFISDMYDTIFELSEVMPLIEFPFCVEIGDTFEVGTLSFGGVKYNNDGDAVAPVIIEIFGPVQTPKITNHTTGEFIQVHTPIHANERMLINTSFSNKRVMIIDDTGQERNAFHYIDLASTFFQLVPGENHIDFDAEAGNDTAKVNVYFKRMWVGI